MTTPDDIRQDIELKVVELLKEKVAAGTMTEERSQQIAKIILDTLQPGMTLEALYKAIPKLDDTASEISPIIVPYLRDYEEHVTKKAQNQVQNFIHQGQYNAATELAEKAVRQDVKLVWTARAAAPKGTTTP